MAVFTDISENKLKKFLELYDIGKLASFEGISEGIQNTNFIVQTTKSKYILTLYEDKRIFSSLPFFFSFMEHLENKKIPCASPVHASDGSILQKLANRPAAIVNFLPGKWPKTIRSEHCAEVGKYSALMHKAAKDFKQKRDDSVFGAVEYWNKRIKEESLDINSLKSGLSDEIDKSFRKIKSQWPDNLPSGAIHGDLFPDNVLFEGGKVSGIIDFYMSHNDFFAMDLANTLTQWCFEHGAEFNITKAKAMLSAYNKVRKLSDAELKALPTLASAAATKWFLTRLYTWFNPSKGAMVNRKDPLEQLGKLRFHLQIKSASEYGL